MDGVCDMDLEKTRGKYNSYKEFLLNELMYIDSMFELYIYLKNQHVSRLDILNISPAFFGLTENALLESATIRLSRLYDSDKKTVTLKKFLNHVEQNRKLIFNENDQPVIIDQIRDDNKKFEDFSEKINSLKEVRDTSLAHNDYCKLEDGFDVWAGKNIVIRDIRALIAFGENLINNYSRYSSNTAHSIKATNKLDVEYMLRVLEKNRKR
jgi:hypothetical protein